jgi:hypothetical protein
VIETAARRLFGMSLSASQLFEAGMSLSPDARKDVAMRLLETVDPDETLDRSAEAWLHVEVPEAYDALHADPSRGIPAHDVRAHFADKWADRT